MMTLRRLLTVHDEAIIAAAVAWVREAAAVDLAERPSAETRALVVESVRVYAALLLDDPRPPDAFSTQRFRISTLLRGCFAFHRALGPVLARHSVPHHLAFAILRQVDDACSETAFPSGHVGTNILWIDRSADDRLELGCGDDGVGISPQLLRRVYEPFFATARGRGGSGLGLHIVHDLVTDLLCGTLRAESTPGRGARFTVRFPAHVEA